MWTKPTAYIIRSRLGPCACPPLMFFLIINSLRYLNLADPKRPNLSQTEGLEVSSFIHDSAYNLALTFFSKKKRIERSLLSFLRHDAMTVAICTAQLRCE